MLSRQDRFCGNILLYDYLSTKRAPVFLNRSLTRVLQVHQHLVNKGGDTEHYAVSDNHLRSQWRPPSWDDLDDMVATERANGSFNLEVHCIRLHGKQSSTHIDDQIPRTRKSRPLMRVKSSMRASFYPEGSRVCRTKSIETVVLKADSRNRPGNVIVDMCPVVIEPQNLASSSRHTLFDSSYLMELRMTMASLDEAKEFYDYVGVKDVSEIPLQLVTVYNNILDCSTGTTVIQMQDHTKQLVFDLEVSMYWASTTRASILQRHNRNLRSRHEPKRPYLTPPLDTDHQPKTQLKYVYGSKVVETATLSCPIDRCRVRRLASIKDLRMHLDSWHDHFKYTAVQEMVDNEGVQHWRFDCEIAEHRTDQRASIHADEPFDNHVNAPSQPFDADKYLEGNTEFQQAATQYQPSKHVWSKGKSASAATIRRPLTLRRKPPEEVQARPARPARTYVVPEAPRGITLFRSLTKRPLQAGEVVSESDDDLDLGWMQLRKHAEVDKEDITKAEKRFQKIFDDFMQNENLHADIHLSDAVIRFTREKGSSIDQGLLEELDFKLQELFEDKIISKNVHTACLEMVCTGGTGAPVTDEVLQKLTDVQDRLHTARQRLNDKFQLRRLGKSKGRAKFSDTGHITPNTADSDGDVDMRTATLRSEASRQPSQPIPATEPVYDECYCGEDAMSSYSDSPVIACNQIDCIRRYFHLECAQRHTKKPLPLPSPRKRDWTCEDCKITSKIAT